MKWGNVVCTVHPVSLQRCGKMVSGEVNAHHICTSCGRQFIAVYDPPKGYSDAIKQECLTLYVNGMGFRGIERFQGVHHPTVIYWLKQLGKQLPDTPQESWMNWKRLWAQKKLLGGCGRRWIIFASAFWLGYEATIVRRHSHLWGKYSTAGSAISLSQLEGKFTLDSLKPVLLLWVRLFFDESRRRKYPFASLPGTTTPKNIVLFQVRGDAQVIAAIATSLLKVLENTRTYLNHPFVQ